MSKFRCSSCDKMAAVGKYEPFYRSGKGPQTTTVKICMPCANKKRPGETVAALSKRIAKK